MRTFFLSLLLGAALLVPTVTLAADTTFFGEIFPTACKCDTATIGYESAPAFGCVMLVLQNIISLGLSFGVALFVIIASYAGFLFMTSPMNPRNREMGRSVLLNAVVGLVIALSAWLLVDFIMKALYNPEANFNGSRIGPWNEILVGDGTPQSTCIPKANQGALGSYGNAADPAPTTGGGAPTESDTAKAARITAFVAAASSAGLTAKYEVQTSGRKSTLVQAGAPEGSIAVVAAITAEHFSVYGSGGSGGTVSEALRANPSCPTCVDITGPSCTNNCKVVPAFANALNSISRSGAIGNWVVTEAFPPTSRHVSTCHYNGTCVDVNFR